MRGIKAYHFKEKPVKIIDQYRLLKLNEIELKYDNPRTIFDDEEMDELISSVKESGVLNPIWCSVEDNTYYLIAGERRLRASKSVGLSEIPTRLFQIDSEKEARILQTIENEQRADLSQEEKFNQFTKMEILGMSIADMAKMTGINATTVRDILNLKSLNQEIFSNKKVADFAKTQLSRLRPNEQNVMAKKLMDEKMTSRRLYDDVVKNLNILEKDETLDKDIKEKIRSAVIEKATTDVQASRIISREKEKIKMIKEGKMPKIIDNAVVQRYIDQSDEYYRLLLEMIESKVEIADPTLVKSLYISIMSIKETLDELTERID